MSSLLNEKLQAEIGDIFRRVAYDLNIVDTLGLSHYESSINTTRIDETTFVQLFENLGSDKALIQTIPKPMSQFFIYRAARDGFVIDLYGCLEYRQYHLDLIMEKDNSAEYVKKNNEMEQQNSLLRSAYAIAQRKGEDTNWEAFENNLRKELLKQAGVPGSTDEQITLRASCTARTYRIDPSLLE